MTRPEALAKLLALPDEPCLHRSYRYTCPRSPFVDPEILKRNLAMAYVTHCRQELQAGGDISCVVSVRRLRMVRKA